MVACILEVKSLVSMLPFQGLVLLTSLSQPTWPFVCFSSTFNLNIDSNKRKYAPRYVVLLYYPFPCSWFHHLDP